MQAGATAPRILLRHHQVPASFICAQHMGGLMGEIVNLKRFKKKAARDRAAKDADVRRASFGRTKAERQQQQEQDRKLNSVLDQHRIGEDQT